VRRLGLGFIAAALVAGASPAEAVPIGAGLTLSGTAVIVSDYRYRGVSQTLGDPAPQLGFTVRQKDGFYAGAWTSYVRFYSHHASGRRNGADTEVDLYGGWTGRISRKTSVDVGFTYYVFPGVAGVGDMGEATLVVTQSIGRAELRVGGAYDWRQHGLEDRVVYAYGEAALPIAGTRLTMRAHGGRTVYGPRYRFAHDYWDWSIGGEARFGRFTAGLAYVDTDLAGVSHSGAGAVASLGFAF